MSKSHRSKKRRTTRPMSPEVARALAASRSRAAVLVDLASQLRRTTGIEFHGGHELPGLHKISAALLEYAAPLLEAGPESPSLKQLENILDFASAAWNAGVLEDKEGDEPAGDLVRAMVKHLRFPEQEGRQLVEYMLQRKRETFQEDRRFIVDVRVTDGGDQYHVTATSVDDGPSR